MRTAIHVPLAAFAAFAALALAACASSSGAPEPVAQPVTMRAGTNAGNVTLRGTSVSAPNVVEVNAPVARVWQALPSVYEALRVPVTTVVTNDMLLGNYRVKVRRELGAAPLSRYLSCGSGSGGQNADTYDVTLTLLTQVAGGSGAAASRVITTVEANAVSAAFGGAPVPCTSTGDLETRIADMIRERVR
jgi:hypothetical protein